MKNEIINRKDIMEKIMPLIENTAMRYNLIPIEVDFSKENHRWFLRIYLFSYDHEVNLADCENVTRSINDFLDELIPVKYYLEVSSPGLDRKLKSDKEYVIFQGREIVLKLTSPLDEDGEAGEKVFNAKILDFDEHEGLKIMRTEDGNEFLVPKKKIHSVRLFFDDKKIDIKKIDIE